jgi:hypothetical protein
LITLRTRLAVLVLVAVLPGFWLLRGLATAERSQREQAALASLAAAARQVKEQQQSAILAARGLLAAFAETGPVQGLHEAGCMRLAARLLRKDTQFANVAAATPDGRVFCNGFPLPGFSITDRLYFRRALERRGFAAGDTSSGGPPTARASTSRASRWAVTARSGPSSSSGSI